MRRNGGPQCHGRLHVDYMLTMITMMCSDVLHQLYRYVQYGMCSKKDVVCGIMW